MRASTSRQQKVGTRHKLGYLVPPAYRHRTTDNPGGAAMQGGY